MLEWLKKMLGCPPEVRIDPLSSLPDFENFVYSSNLSDQGKYHLAYVKFRETERRLAMVKFAFDQNGESNPRFRVFLNDAVSAFLLTFEATIQFIQQGWGDNYFIWLGNQSEYDTYVRGLRTLRHFEAHVEPRQIPRQVNLHISSTLGGSSVKSEPTSTWKLSTLTEADLKKLKTKPLPLERLEEWNLFVNSYDALTIFQVGTFRLLNLIQNAERLPQ